MKKTLLLVLSVAACSDPTKVAPLPTTGAIAGVVVLQSTGQPVAHVQITATAAAANGTQSSYTAQDTTDSLGAFGFDVVPAGYGALNMRNLPAGCDSTIAVETHVLGGVVDSMTVPLPC